MRVARRPSLSVTAPAIIAAHQTIPAASPQVRRRRSRLSRVTGRLALSGAAAVLLGAVLTIATSPASAQVLPPNTSSDCRGRVPIVVASDFDAQSDIYSAWTLASALDTTCVVLAGARAAPMPQDQRTRLNAAQQSGWIVGGEAAVPTWKLPIGRTDTRLAGRDRWHTAEMVGDVAAGRSAGALATSATASESSTEATQGDVLSTDSADWLTRWATAWVAEERRYVEFWSTWWSTFSREYDEFVPAIDAYAISGCDIWDTHPSPYCLQLLKDAAWEGRYFFEHLAEGASRAGCRALAAANRAWAAWWESVSHEALYSYDGVTIDSDITPMRITRETSDSCPTPSF